MVYTRTCVYECVCTYIHICVCIYIYMCICVYTCRHLNTVTLQHQACPPAAKYLTDKDYASKTLYKYIHMSLFVLTCVYTYMCIYIYTHYMGLVFSIQHLDLLGVVYHTPHPWVPALETVSILLKAIMFDTQRLQMGVCKYKRYPCCIMFSFWTRDLKMLGTWRRGACKTQGPQHRRKDYKDTATRIPNL